jgi:23S rRNA (adenine2503-C2)-methyltransferase
MATSPPWASPTTPRKNSPTWSLSNSPPSAAVDAGDPTAVVESVKAASDIYAPVGGEVVEVNPEVEADPSLVNTDPYGKGWIFKLRVKNPGRLHADGCRGLSGAHFLSVLIPANPALYGESSDRRTLCVSSQVGCAYGCKFCASGLAGFTRNLDAAEISDQVIAAERLSGERVDNLVFMGMGEPLANLENLLDAIALITGSDTLHLGARHLTISTSGLVPQIRRLASHPQQVRLAISLHGATDEVRERIMPVNRKWPLAELVAALEYWNSLKNQKLTLEFILIDGVNDSLDQAGHLARLAQRVRAKVNLIPYNTVEGLDWKRPSDTRCRAFRDVLKQAGIPATLRLEKGHDIDAACGQLRLKKETAEGIISAV